jgi:hypothetical protein
MLLSQLLHLPVYHKPLSLNCFFDLGSAIGARLRRLLSNLSATWVASGESTSWLPSLDASATVAGEGGTRAPACAARSGRGN